MRARLFSLVVALIVLLFLGLTAFAQGDRGAITGLITDAANGVIPNVEVIATQLDTNSTFKAVTTSGGVYRIPCLPPGTYRIWAGIQGFKTAVVDRWWSRLRR